MSHGHETYNRPKWFIWFYNQTIARYESWLMKTRYEKSLAFLKENRSAGKVLADLGCGVGALTLPALRMGYKVKAIDFSAEALIASKANIEAADPSLLRNVEFLQLDIVRDSLPPSDVAIAIGVFPYISEPEKAFANILSSTHCLYVLNTDPDHWINRLRSRISFLNVRELHFHHRQQVNQIVRASGFEIVRRETFASGYLDTCIKENCSTT